MRLDLMPNADEGLYVDQRMCRSPTAYQIGERVTASNGTASVYPQSVEMVDPVVNTSCS